MLVYSIISFFVKRYISLTWPSRDRNFNKIVICTAVTFLVAHSITTKDFTTKDFMIGIALSTVFSTIGKPLIQFIRNQWILWYFKNSDRKNILYCEPTLKSPKYTLKSFYPHTSLGRSLARNFWLEYIAAYKIQDLIIVNENHKKSLQKRFSNVSLASEEEIEELVKKKIKSKERYIEMKI